MSKYLIEDTTLTSIADAVRDKAGTSELIKVSDLPTAISNIETGGGGGGGIEIPAITGNCQYRFANDGWNWLLENYFEEVVTQDISSASYMFYTSKQLTEIPEINFREGGGAVDYMFYYCSGIENIPAIDFKQTSSQASRDIFSYCSNLKEIGKLSNWYPGTMQNAFNSCYNLRFLPEFENFNATAINSNAYYGASYLFNNCRSLRSISEELLSLFTGKWTTSNSSIYNNLFNYCVSLDEIKGVPTVISTLTASNFQNTFNGVHRVKNIIFATQADGTPYTANWKNQNIILSSYVGYSTADYSKIVNYNSGITADKLVTDDATYQALKDDPDWFTTDVNYSRYNHDSAVRTINSLPDTSAYLATAGGTNTIRFEGEAGALTDGGAINTLTEEEIAVATAKGWTVAFS